MYVGPIKEDGLLGLDFLYAQDCILTHSALKPNGHSEAWELHGSPPQAAIIVMACDVTIPAESQFIVKGEAVTRDFGSTYGVIESFSMDSELRVLVGSIFVDPSRDNGLPVRILNPSAEDIILKRGTVIGYLYEVETFGSLSSDERSGGTRDINHMITNDTHQDPCVTEWPQALQELYQNSTAMLDTDQQAQLRAVLGKHVELFTKSAEDLGRCDVV